METVVVVVGFGLSAALVAWLVSRWENRKHQEKRKKRYPRPWE